MPHFSRTDDETTTTEGFLSVCVTLLLLCDDKNFTKLKVSFSLSLYLLSNQMTDDDDDDDDDDCTTTVEAAHRSSFFVVSSHNKKKFKI